PAPLLSHEEQTRAVEEVPAQGEPAAGRRHAVDEREKPAFQVDEVREIRIAELHADGPGDRADQPLSAPATQLPRKPWCSLGLQQERVYRPNDQYVQADAIPPCPLLVDDGKSTGVGVGVRPYQIDVLTPHVFSV